MALVLTPGPGNAATITCTGCPACLVVGSLTSTQLEHVVTRLEPEHVCA